MLDLNKAVILNDELLTNEVFLDKNGVLLVVKFMKGNCVSDTICNLRTKVDVDRVITNYKDFAYLFVPISEELSNELNNNWDSVRKVKSEVPLFIEKYGVHPKDVMACGDTKATNGFAKHYIPNVQHVDTSDVYSLSDKEKAAKLGKFTNNYKCFANNNYKVTINDKANGGLIYHEDVLSSWNCLMEVLHHPNHGIIIKKYK